MSQTIDSRGVSKVDKVILKATVEFYQVPIKKYSVESFQIVQNPQRYEWRVKDAQFIE